MVRGPVVDWDLRRLRLPVRRLRVAVGHIAPTGTTAACVITVTIEQSQQVLGRLWCRLQTSLKQLRRSLKRSIGSSPDFV